MAQKPTRSLASIDRGRLEANSSTTYIFFPTQTLYFFGLSLFFFAFAFIMLLITFGSIFFGPAFCAALPFEDFLAALATTALTSTAGCHNPGKLSMPKSFVYLHTASFHVGRFPCSPMYVRHTSVASPSPYLKWARRKIRKPRNPQILEKRTNPLHPQPMLEHCVSPPIKTIKHDRPRLRTYIGLQGRGRSMMSKKAQSCKLWCAASKDADLYSHGIMSLYPNKMVSMILRRQSCGHGCFNASCTFPPKRIAAKAGDA